LDSPFSIEEVHKVIAEAPKEKESGPDGFLGLFFAVCWGIIKDDIMVAVQQFFTSNQQGLHLLNQAYVVLIPKKSCPQRVSDFRLVSLTHSFAKLVYKILANRLGLELGNLVAVNQTAFIKKRCLHDNFIYVQQLVKDLHRKKMPALFIKLDISKVFDTVNWPYLLDILAHLGFG
jgi:hypothetical protein